MSDGPWRMDLAVFGFWLRGADALAEASGPDALAAASDAAVSALQGQPSLLLAQGADRVLVAWPALESAPLALLELRSVIDIAVSPWNIGPIVAAAGYGPLLLGAHGGAWGAEIVRVERLLAPWVGGDLACTHAFFQAISLPEGIGGFRARHALEHLAGTPYHLLIDGR